MSDTQVLIKTDTWKIKVALGLGGMVVIIILAFLYRIEIGIVALVIGSGYAVRVYFLALHQKKLLTYEQRRIEAETTKAEAEAAQAYVRKYFVETNTGVFVLAGIDVDKFYPAVSASKPFADVPLLPAAVEDVPTCRKLLDIDFIHLLVVGPSNSGKTTVLCHLVDNAPNNTLIYALDPHSQFNEWPARVNQIIGNGRDYQAINAKLLDLISVMNRRYNGLEPISQKVMIFADEWLGILDKCPDADNFFNTIGSEARKVNMSLVISSISATVDDLGVSAAIRDNLAQLTLSRSWQRQNLGELKWSRVDKEMVELPGVYRQRYALPARVVQPTQPEEFEPLPILDDGPVFSPSADELRIYELYLQGTSLRKISQEVFNSVGGNQVNDIKATLAKFGVSV